MKDYRKKQLELLAELDSVCMENDIPYILSCHTARAAYLRQDFAEKIAAPTIAVHYKDALKLMELIQKNDRFFESSVYNRKIPRNIIRYSDVKTSMIKVNELGCFKSYGIGVEIELLRSVPQKHLLNRAFVLLEVLTALSANLRSSSRAWSCVLGPFAFIESFVLKYMYSYGSVQDKCFRVSRFPKKSLEFPASYLKERQPALIGGRSFFIPESIDKYMQSEFDENWRKTDVEKAVEDMHLTVFDTGLAYGASLRYIEMLDAGGARIPWVRWFLLRGKMRFLRKRIEGYWDILFSTKERFDLWREYMPQKENICALYSQGDTAMLRNLLDSYFVQLARYEKKGIAICFDKEIFDIAMSTLESEGKAAYAKRLQAIVRPEHFEPIKIGVNKHD